jgi:hypothetical protein
MSVGLHDIGRKGSGAPEQVDHQDKQDKNDQRSHKKLLKVK